MVDHLPIWMPRCSARRHEIIVAVVYLEIVERSRQYWKRPKIHASIDNHFPELREVLQKFGQGVPAALMKHQRTQLSEKIIEFRDRSLEVASEELEFVQFIWTILRVHHPCWVLHAVIARRFSALEGTSEGKDLQEHLPVYLDCSYHHSNAVSGL